jgi:hypothetical protein
MTIILNGTAGITFPDGTTQVDGLSTPVPVADGGTGAATLTANNVILGNGTSSVQLVAPGTTGNILTSNGTTWTSSAPPSGGVTSFNGNTGALDGWQEVTTATFGSGTTTISIGSLPADYKVFRFLITGATSSTNSNFEPCVRVSTDGGSSYISSSVYSLQSSLVSSFSGWQYAASRNSSRWSLCAGSQLFPQDTNSDDPFIVDLTLTQSANGQNTKLHGTIGAIVTGSGNQQLSTTTLVNGVMSNTSYINGFQFFRNDGSKTINAGTYYVYGAK